MLKNVAGQKIGAQMVDTDGAAFTSAVTVYVTGDAGTQAAGSVGSGACTHEGNGYHTYSPDQAETNYDLIAFTFVGTGAVPVTTQIYTQANLDARLEAIEDRIAEQVPEGPVAVIPAGDAGQTTAYIRCLDSAGAVESGVIVHIQMVRPKPAATGYAFSGDALEGESDGDGIAAILIPRAPGAIFRAWRGDTGRQITFAGVDAETVAIPDLLGD